MSFAVAVLKQSKAKQSKAKQSCKKRVIKAEASIPNTHEMNMK